MNKKILYCGFISLALGLAIIPTMAAPNTDFFTTTTTRRVQPKKEQQDSKGSQNQTSTNKNKQYYCVAKKPLKSFKSKDELFYPIMYNTKDSKDTACKKAAYKVYGSDYEKYGEEKIANIVAYKKACMVALNNTKHNCAPVIEEERAGVGFNCIITYADGPDKPTLLYVKDKGYNWSNIYTPCIVSSLNDFFLKHGTVRILGADPVYGQYIILNPKRQTHAVPIKDLPNFKSIKK